ncbi:rhomboid family intramembrane serine protease [Halorientalis marina]|jgi:membrane associated rhomboid family serine protease|uniref:rhomboid family intramembrane serine protease n=1 Tax=Halorientalis marina TaxID=2931976 RepID=UPI001FF52E63|nr:rhomboid family intramembrane serine protease [Halorientalis marina]
MVSVRSPTLTTLALFAVVFLLETVVGLLALLGLGGTWSVLFVLSAPLAEHPWTLVTSVYAHAGVSHLVANALALLVPGFVLERATTRLRYHAFFVGSGLLAGVAEVTLGGLVGTPAGVLGASGAVFAVIGYLLTSNRLTDAVVRGVSLSPNVQFVLFALLAVLVTVATGSPGVALVAHFTGLFVGLVSGRLHLLRTGTARADRTPRS